MGPIGCEGQALPHGVWNLNPRVYATMTPAGGTIFCWCSKSQKRNELASPHSGLSTPDGATSRNESAGRRPEVFETRQVDLGAMHVSIGSPEITTGDAMYATDVEFNRFRYDNGPSKRCRGTESVIHWRRRFSDWVATGPDGQSRMWQENHAGRSRCFRTWQQ